MSHRNNRHRTRRRRNPWLSLRSERRHLSKGEAVVAVVVVIAAIIGFALAHRQGSAEAVAVELLPPGGDVRLAATTFEDGHAHFYRQTTTNGKQIQFFVINGTDGKIRAAFDACELCYKEHRGFRQAGSVMVCNYCRRTSSVMQIGSTPVRADCNPVPIESAVEGEHTLLKAASLQNGAKYFQTSGAVE